MILFGLYTGQRLGDLASLTWSNVDMGLKELSLVSGKTGRQMSVPLAPSLVRLLDSLTPGADLDTPLFPSAFAILERNQRVGTLSNQFYEILVSAGLATKRSHKSTGKGRDAKRSLDGLSFHCLRHNATSMLKNAGVSDAVARDIIGHDSAAVSASYTHIETETKRRAVDNLPDIWPSSNESTEKASLGP